MKKDKTLSKLIAAVMNDPRCPEELYNAMADALANIQSGRGPKDTPGLIEFVLSRRNEIEARGTNEQRVAYQHSATT